MGKNLKIAVGSDHGGLDLKNQLLSYLQSRGYFVQDCGTHSKDAVDYPRIAYTVARLVSSGSCDRGILVDGAGIGSAMAANKVRGVRAAACYSVALAKNSREHNDANVLVMGERVIGKGVALEIVKTWLDTPFAGGRHQKRLDKIANIDRSIAVK